MLKFKNVSVVYGKKEILHNINTEFEKNKITAIIGKNGCGKSTLISCLNSQAKYTGEILLEDESISALPLKERAKRIAVLPQFLSNANLTVEETVRMGRLPYLDFGKRLTENDRELTETAIENMELAPLRNKTLNTLSGGEKQKAYLAMILAQNTDIVVLDEPTTYMDISFGAQFMRKLVSLRDEQNKTIITVMHDLTSATDFADNITVIDSGKTVFSGSTEECIASGIIEKVFGVVKCEYIENGVKKVCYKG